MEFLIKNIALSRIYLDDKNPRHDPIENEPEIIGALLEKENVKPLARHIAKSGGISPLERIAVIPHPKIKNAYIAVEGNRRVCSIKLLADPDKAPTEADKKYFRKLLLSMPNVVSAVETVVFADRATARPWISLRHEGEQGGVGTKSWNTGQIARFNAMGESKTSNPNIQALLLIDYVREQNLLSAAQIAALGITTLTRYLSNPIFRDALGLVDGRSITISVPKDQFDHAVTRFLMDALDPESGVTSRTKVVDRKEYANTLRSDGDAPTTRGLPPTDLLSTSSEPDAKVVVEVEPQKTPVKRNNRSPDDRKKIIPTDFAVRIKDPILKRLYDELRALDADEFPFGATYLLRAVIERTATLFLKQNGKAPPSELHNKLAQVNTLLTSQGVSERELKVLRVMSNDKESRYSPDSIGHFVHGGAVPTRKEAIATWDSIQPAIKIMLDLLK